MKGALKQGMEKCSGESLKELNLESHYPDEKVAFRKSSKIASSSVAFEKEPKVRGKRKIQLQGRQNQVSCTTTRCKKCQFSPTSIENGHNDSCTFV